MRLDVNGAALWFDVSGPELTVGDEIRSRPTLVTVHGGPGLDHTGLRGSLAPFEAEAQVVYYDQRGHGRSDFGDAQHWNLRTWAGDLRALCDGLGISRPVVLGSSFGGFVAVTYAALYPEHPGGLVLTNTTGGNSDPAKSVEIFRRIGGDRAAAIAAQDFAELSEKSAAEFNRVCHPLFSAKPGYVEEAERRMRLSIHTTEVNLHYWREEAPRFDPWQLLSDVTCPVLVIAGEDDPMCPIDMVESLVDALVNAPVEFVRLKGARHAVFRDAPDEVFAALRSFLRKHGGHGEPASP